MKTKTLAGMLLAGIASAGVSQKAQAQDWDIHRVMGSINWPAPNMSLYEDKLYYANIQGFPHAGGGPPNEGDPWAWEQMYEQNLTTDTRRLIRSVDFGANGREFYPSAREERIILSYVNGGGLAEMDHQTGAILNLSFGNEGHHPSFYGENLVWSQPQASNLLDSIQLRNLTTGQQYQLTQNTTNRQNFPSIFGDLVVWQENSLNTPSWGLTTFNLSTGQKTNIQKMMGDENVSYTNPEIYGNEIVFEKSGDIWLYNLANSQFQQVSATPFYETNPTIWGDRIAWAQEGPDQGDFSQYYWNYYVADRIPAPSSLGLLALAGLTASKRKR